MFRKADFGVYATSKPKTKATVAVYLALASIFLWC